MTVLLFFYETPKLIFARRTESQTETFFWEVTKSFTKFKMQLNHQYFLHEVKSKSPSDRNTSFQIRVSQLIFREIQDKLLSHNTTFQLDLLKDII